MLKSFPKPQKYTHKINMLYFYMHPKVFPKRKLKIFHVFPKEKKRTLPFGSILSTIYKILINSSRAPQSPPPTNKKTYLSLFGL